MPPRLIHLVRHAQGYHNLNWQHHLRDPTLTDLGHSQCQILASNFPYHNSITHIICSPLKRTIQTTLESFYPTITRLVSENEDFKIRADPYFQENGEWECDLGSTIPEVQKFLSTIVDKENVKEGTPRGYEHQSHLDFSEVRTSTPEWPEKRGIFAARNVDKRGTYARNFLFENYNEDEEVIIVSHGGYLHVLTEDWESYDDIKGTGWENTERRSFVLKKNEEGKVKLEETEESIKNRRAHHAEGDTDSGTERRETEVAGHHGNSKN
ncbi:hypothetical protein AOL_s00210g357 [Orbilia oligospora ATCC 24927]|uniref:Phosphoglycerate mutase-like protein n=2 Tax=Orbilia oligospora TaxID=2813651 RepID=G1XSJ8_ARTOA|nr:hypothetical protein AOL_s00210g357 [Orbilia oligospora ATCC 24927]EGX43910.1 hypothetical protein AOL_s00210g357 [Orbilia oligospora ATCC 24927]KAF3279046.1 hypothetical protein TWF970_004155 [Orbilia oligospora]